MENNLYISKNIIAIPTETGTNFRINTNALSINKLDEIQGALEFLKKKGTCSFILPDDIQLEGDYRFPYAFNSSMKLTNNKFDLNAICNLLSEYENVESFIECNIRKLMIETLWLSNEGLKINKTDGNSIRLSKNLSFVFTGIEDLSTTNVRANQDGREDLTANNATNVGAALIAFIGHKMNPDELQRIIDSFLVKCSSDKEFDHMDLTIKAITHILRNELIQIEAKRSIYGNQKLRS